MPFQHTPPDKHKIDKSGPLSGGARTFIARFSLVRHPDAPLAQKRENFTFRYFFGSSRNSLRSRRRSPATPLILS
jgi:hypothetical protein